MPSFTFTKESTMPVSAQQLYDWHARPGAFQRLIPPWEPVRLLEHRGGFEPGAQMEIEVPLGPFKQRWLAQLENVEEGRQFCDRQLQGPFTQWYHTHRFKPIDETACTLSDHIEFRLPLGIVGAKLGREFIINKLHRMFDYRHAVLANDLETHRRYSFEHPQRIAIAGANGLIGSNLAAFLSTGGHRVIQIVRPHAKVIGETAHWQPGKGEIDLSALDGLDVLIHLGGDNIASGRWTEEKKQRILSSRADVTRFLCEKLLTLPNPPQTVITASAVGYYGNRGDEILNEASEPDGSFLSQVSQQWEAATQPLQDRGIRTAHLRLGAVLTPAGGALQKMLTPFWLGMGGRLGPGTQYMSWISMEDVLRSVLHIMHRSSLSGPVNLTAPEPCTNAEFTQALAHVLHRPALFPAPSVALRAVLGEMADALLLSSTRVIPQALLDTDFEFVHGDLENTLCRLLGR